jgi:hypothetical protein
MTWRSYIGLPHEIAADPRIGAAADCLLLAFVVQDELGIAHPEPDERWFDLARAERWTELSALFFRHAVEQKEPADGMVTLLVGPQRKLGVAVRVDGGSLTVNERKGVIFIPQPVKDWGVWYSWVD